jgi:hypothetical protein
MKPKIKIAYLIKYLPTDKGSGELAYEGPGVFTGETTPDVNTGEILYWMEELKLDPGFSDGGWFSELDIIEESTNE